MATATLVAPPTAKADGNDKSQTVAAPAVSSTTTKFAGEIDPLILRTPACILKPYSFFVSWQGVLTLAYKGFPPALCQLKQQLSDTYPSLPRENPGSRWPKTSLGALKDNKRLSPEQLETLIAICKEASGVFQNPSSPRMHSVFVDKLAVVLYECRCLERQLLKHEVPLAEVVDSSEATPEEQQRVEGIIAEADDPNYWFHASRDGSREAHYRGTALGATLVHELGCFKPGAADVGADGFSAALPDAVRRFQQRVEEALPGMYSWFGEESLHITVRALMG